MKTISSRRNLKIMLKTRMLLKRKLHRLPNFFTLSNALFGFSSIIFSSNGDLVPAAYFILFGAFFDAIDGRLARLMGVTSELGGQLDSLCDAISFCLAPAILMYHWELYRAGIIGFFASALFLLAGITRLARFNITKENQTIFFLGVPTTISGCFLATIFLTTGTLATHPYFIVVLITTVISLAYLMISSINFPTFKHITKWSYGLCLILFTMCIITLGFTKMLLGIFIMYFCFSFEEALRRSLRNRKNRIKKCAKAF